MTFQIAFTKPAYSVPEFAEAVGLSETVIYEKIRAGDLLAVYPTRTKKIITLEEGLRWLKSLPLEPEQAA